MERRASAVWQGSLKEGKGTVTTASGVLTDTQYSFTSRFEEGTGTNPEELIAAAHAGCFSMALSAILGESGLVPDRIATSATVTFKPVDGAPTLTDIRLEVEAKVPGATEAAFAEAAEKAKTGCPISRVLNTRITMVAKLVP
ncbi:MAG: OsmC family protein [Armatimonadetes bacterium]|nr:OsmC family protein [Armatimonadota bacterium]